MVVLAQALVSRPKFLLVDELSLGLAPVIVKRLAPVLTEVADSGVGVLLIEQFAHVALGVSKSAYVIEGGQIRYKGTAAELRGAIRSCCSRRTCCATPTRRSSRRSRPRRAPRSSPAPDDASGRYRPRSRSRTSSVHSCVRMIR